VKWELHHGLKSVVIAMGLLTLVSCTAPVEIVAPPPIEPASSPTTLPSAEPTRADARNLHTDEDRIGNLIRLILPEVDITRKTVDLTEIESGGVGADSGIPSLHYPTYETVTAASAWVAGREPVVVVEIGGIAHIYPIQILIWHEVVNDEIAGVPVLVTFCPLCNTAIAFDRRVNGEERRFGVSGLLRESDLLLYDYQSITLWQQLTGEAIVGTDAGLRLTFLPAQIVSFQDARETYPDARVLSQMTGHVRPYGLNPYEGYDDIDSGLIFKSSFDDGRLLAKDRVLAVEYLGKAVAFPFQILQRELVMHTEIEDTPVVAFWQPGVATALDSSDIASGRDIGAAGAFIAALDGLPLTFEARAGAIFDVGTGSQWNVLGTATAGPLAGARLQALPGGSHFWFIWAVFKPDTEVIRN